MVDSLDVAGYSRFYVLNENTAYHASDEEKLPVDFSVFRFRKGETGAEEIITADLRFFLGVVRRIWRNIRMQIRRMSVAL